MEAMTQWISAEEREEISDNLELPNNNGSFIQVFLQNLMAMSVECKDELPALEERTDRMNSMVLS